MADSAPIKVGDTAPEFALMDQDKNTVKLADFRGKNNVMLLFYPMDFSPVCTEEHCKFGAELPQVAPSKDTVVFGVSCDSPFSHAAFRKQYNIPYSLLSDTSRKMAKAYGMFAGEEPYNCTKRGTVVIDKQGKIAVYKEVPMKEPRKTEDLTEAMSMAMQQRDNMGGSSVSASR